MRAGRLGAPLERNEWFQPVGGAPSSHIVKPLSARRAVELAEEEYGHRLAAGLGLAHTSVELTELGGWNALVIERYDRVDSESGAEPSLRARSEAARGQQPGEQIHGGTAASLDASKTRIHQEDFNQALGLSGDEKYQEFGGRARLQRVAEVVRDHAPDDLRVLVRLLTLAVAVGNLDQHTKNFALLHPASGPPRLAPAYDMVPMAHRPGFDGRLALAVGGEYRLAAVTVEHLRGEVRGWGAVPAEVDAALEQLIAVVDAERPLPGAEPVAPMVRVATERLLRGEPIGDAFTR